MKKLEENSQYARYDMNSDGTVTDEELERSERMLQIENMDKLQDQQRVMAWAALWLPFLLIMFMVVYASTETINALMGIATTYVGAMGTIVVAFMAVSGWVRTSMHKASE
jgi:hypothetical protein